MAVKFSIVNGTSLCMFAALSSLSCAGLDVPDAPDMSELNASYESPTGTLTDENTADVVDELNRRLTLIASARNLDFVVGSIEKAAKAVADVSNASGDKSSTIKLDAVGAITSTCPGENDDPTDPANGTVSYKLTVEETFLEPTLWGTFDDCTIEDSGATLRLSGELRIYLKKESPLTSIDLSRVLFYFNGTVKRDDAAAEPGEFSFRVVDRQQLEVAIPVADGDVVFAIEQDASSSAVRARDGAFCCDFDDQICTAVASASCDAPAVGDTQWTW